MIIRELKPSYKVINKNTLVTFCENPIIYEDKITSIRNQAYQSAYEVGCIKLRQEECHCFLNDDYLVIDKWMDTTGEVYLVVTPEDEENECLAFITTRSSLIPVVYYEKEDPKRQVVFAKNKKAQDILVLINEYGNRAKVTRSENDNFDLEKAVLYALLKAQGFPREIINEYLRLAREAYCKFQLK